MFKRGDMKGQTIDLNKIKGTWLNVFDRKEMNEHFKCYSVKINHYNGEIDDTKEAKIRVTKLFDYNQYAMKKN